MNLVGGKIQLSAEVMLPRALLKQSEIRIMKVTNIRFETKTKVLPSDGFSRSTIITSQYWNNREKKNEKQKTKKKTFKAGVKKSI